MDNLFHIKLYSLLLIIYYILGTSLSFGLASVLFFDFITFDSIAFVLFAITFLAILILQLVNCFEDYFRSFDIE